jgi:hypothetical protein
VFDQWIARLHRCIARRESMSKSISVGWWTISTSALNRLYRKGFWTTL